MGGWVFLEWNLVLNAYRGFLTAISSWLRRQVNALSSRDHSDGVEV
jgi:hypothetical protein